VLTALLERTGCDAFQIVEGIVWKKIRKYRAGDHASAEERNVLGLALLARRARCDIVAFSRDRDGDVERQRDVDRGIQRMRELFADLVVIGGMAIEDVEAWILVLLGVDGERMPATRTASELEARGITMLQRKVDVVEAASMDNVRPGSLGAWLDRAQKASGPGEHR
jgi:hypothetical protein